jgi:hypothetical protein
MTGLLDLLPALPALPASPWWWPLAWTAACGSVSVLAWYYAEAVARGDYWDRRNKGRLWHVFDVDAWVARAVKAGAVAGAVVAAIPVVLMYPGHLAFAAVAAGSAYVLWRRYRRPRIFQPVSDTYGREDVVYAFGGYNPLTGALIAVKFGHTAQDIEAERRRAQVDKREQTKDVKILATGPGGEPRERQIHARLRDFRYRGSEWFDASTPGALRAVLGEMSRLERRTKLGESTLRLHARRRSLSRPLFRKAA